MNDFIRIAQIIICYVVCKWEIAAYNILSNRTIDT